jgi:hypothetical protein
VTVLVRSVLGALLALAVGSVAWASDPVAPEARARPEPRLVVTSPADGAHQLLDVPALAGGTPSAAARSPTPRCRRTDGCSWVSGTGCASTAYRCGR